MNYYKGKSDEDYIKNHKYNISTKDGESVQASNWDLVVKKGAVLVMSVGDQADQAQRDNCPHCYATDIGVMEDDGWLHW
jgi:hypothetical protein